MRTAFVKEVALSSEGNLEGKCMVRARGRGVSPTETTLASSRKFKRF